MITCCPLTLIPPEIDEVIELADAAQQGAWPIVAGTLDQSASFVTACRVVWSYEPPKEHGRHQSQNHRRHRR